ncbi:NUDIX domain-containing protein [Candidatus Daviesbacteria bacterium]|nr:NUDIX domain-containing protein [Candidatus Daviesbacteria bacterium]
MTKIKKELKRGVDYIGVTCVFYCHDGKGKLLLHKRSKNCRDEQGKWDPGGGSMEFGETFEEAVLREIKEEYCCNVIDLKFLGVHNVLRDHQGTKTHWLALLFSAKVDPKQVRIGEPDYMDEIGWFNLDNLPNPLHSQFPPFFKIFKKEIK